MARILQTIPSSVIVKDLNTARTCAAAASGVIKSFACTAAGQYRVRFRAVLSGVGAATVQVYRNGSAVGILHDIDSNETINVIEDVGGWSAGDSFQLNAVGGGGTSTLTVSGFQVSGSYNTTDIPIPKGRTIADANLT